MHSSLSSSSSSPSHGSLGLEAGNSGARLFYDGFVDEPRHFLDCCSLCRKPLASNRDIFMYRGDTPFCSEECRQEQIEIDEAGENSRKLSVKVSRSRKERRKIHVWADTAVAW
ncbi:DUF581 domain containing protein [Musa troglodytarum]|uniref:DUF581 domain containing protein n=1 Tax=Musa troglodytarum TaxID=320322 RepID=A0A9E7G672_9LILI|nr:DUF581 domain containing protein [Musa troglodytarum]